MACLGILKDEQEYKFERRDLEEVQMALENLICPHNFSEDFLFKEGAKFYDCKNCGISALDHQDSGETKLFSQKMGLNDKQKSSSSFSLDLADYLDTDVNSIYLNGDIDPLSAENFTSKDLDLIFSDKPNMANERMNDETKALSLEEVSAALFPYRSKYGNAKSPLARNASLGFNLNADNFLEYGDWESIFADVTDEDVQAAVGDRSDLNVEVKPSLELVKQELQKHASSMKQEEQTKHQTDENQAINGRSRDALAGVKIEKIEEAPISVDTLVTGKRRAPLLVKGEPKMRKIVSSQQTLSRRDKIRRWLAKRHRRVFSRKEQLGRTAKGQVAQRKKRNHLGRFV